MTDVITTHEESDYFTEFQTNNVIRIMVAALLDIGELDADKEHVAAAYRQFRNDDSLYTVDADRIEFKFGMSEFVVIQEDGYEQYYEEMLESYMDDLEYEGRKTLEDIGIGAYWKFDRDGLARDIEHGGKRGVVIGSYDHNIYELSWAEWFPRVDGRQLFNRITLYYWSI